MLPYVQIFGHSFPMFGIMMLIGMIAALILLHFQRKYSDISEDNFYSFIIYAIIFGMLGSKLLFYIVEYKQILSDPSFIIQSITSGFVFYGALIGGAFGIYICARKTNTCFLKYTDLACQGLNFGQVFGRIGCFCSGCCYGAPTTSKFSVTFPAVPGSSAPSGIPLFPTQLSESAFCFLLAIFLYFLYRKQKKNGILTGTYFILYGVWRFIIEFFRSDERGFIGFLSTSQFISIFTVSFGIFLLIRLKKGMPLKKHS